MYIVIIKISERSSVVHHGKNNPIGMMSDEERMGDVYVRHPP